ncbi:MAG: accessory factor UbiK family protein [gamma proteobacterium symbiont of Bathyaustriella thionipta]|nr:accessory factor UbiK family protein [gamma proteobacterium symbiont of Bathyaustriella thionipta]
MKQFDPKQLDVLAQHLADAMPASLGNLSDDMKQALRQALASGLNRLDLVTREEFDVQAAVLRRSREKLDALQKQLDEMEHQDS